ncbi:MAG: hypothetical protein OXH11_09255 [Candidatus Aminicenantes bacterium]|nr:hypothetical protein [Candidatus Aminicenantes bacterium]
MIELQHDTLTFSFPEVHREARCSISFERTLRIPDDDREYPLPAGLGEFPLHHVDDYAHRLPQRWNDHGGVFMPMYQAEALWISFDGSYPMAVKVSAGKVDAVTGQPFSNELHRRPQDYVVIPDQPWLDGFCVRKGLIRQFVAMPLGQGYTPEEQFTGAAEHGGLQVVVYPMKASQYERLMAERGPDPYEIDAICCSALPYSEMGLAPGGMMRQEVFSDDYGFSVWERDVRSRCFVHLLNSGQYRTVTGYAPPYEPPTAADYTGAGLPWFEYFDADLKALEGAPRLDRLDSVGARRVKAGKPPLDHRENVEPDSTQIERLRKSHLVRDGSAA